MLKEVANTIRGLSADGIEKANSGHPGLPIGCAEIGAVLYGEVLKYDPTCPDWLDRDRFVLSAGHGSMLVYSLLHLSGYDVSLEDLKNFRQLGSKTPGHPEYGYTPGVETTTGPLGQGFANAVGMAIAERMLAERFNDDEYQIIDHYTYTLLGDGGMMEGVVAEAASYAGHLGLGKLIAIYDDNDISIAGSTDLTFSESVKDRFEAYHWHVIDQVDGHDIDAIRQAFKEAREVTDKPSLIIAKTKIACGAPTKEGKAAAHGSPLGAEEIKGLKNKIGLPVDQDFYVSNEVKDYFAERRQSLQVERVSWEETYNQWASVHPDLKASLDCALGLTLPANLREVIEGLEIQAPVATRKSAGIVQQKVAELVEYLVGGSADLAPSNNTYMPKYAEIQREQFGGRNFRFGIREHGMGSIVNGIALHGGFRPFCSTFLVFSDYMRPAIRMAALMKLPIIYIFTHDSVYVGEDGPTHQPIEHVESLRLIPGLNVIRPADEEEAKVAWIQAMENTTGPTALILTRQNLPHLDKVNGFADAYQGGYIIQGTIEKPEVVLMASGSEVSLALEVATLLQEENRMTRVISIPDRCSFAGEDSAYISKLLGDRDTFRVVIEAGVGAGWYRFLGERYHLVSLERYGESGPAKEVVKHLGLSATRIAEDILAKL